jgi:hypothetical protein
MVSIISFIQANLQHSIAASRVLTRAESIKGIDVALIHEPWCHEGRIRGLNIPGYTLFSVGGIDLELVSLQKHDYLDATGILL